jgi:hypothetical protein
VGAVVFEVKFKSNASKSWLRNFLTRFHKSQYLRITRKVVANFVVEEYRIERKHNAKSTFYTESTIVSISSSSGIEKTYLYHTKNSKSSIKQT